MPDRNGYVKKSAGAGRPARAKKELGQNFLINRAVAERMLAESGIDGDFGVLEIGPGRGALTKPLLAEAGKVVAVELDSRLIPTLNDLGSGDRLRVIEGDVLKLDLGALMMSELPGMRRAAVGNLPYYITTPIIMRLLEDRVPVETVTVMVQKEAAERLAAEEGNRLSGAVTLAVRYYAEPRILFDVPPEDFSPAPKVTSAVVRFDIRDRPPVAPNSPERMFAVIKAAFGQRRKTAVNAVSAGTGLQKQRVESAFRDAGIDLFARAERLTLADYARLSDCLNG